MVLTISEATELARRKSGDGLILLIGQAGRDGTDAKLKGDFYVCFCAPCSARHRKYRSPKSLVGRKWRGVHFGLVNVVG